MYVVQGVFRSLVSLNTGDQGGRKVVREGRSATEIIIVIDAAMRKGAFDHLMFLSDGLLQSRAHYALLVCTIYME